ncbi:TrkH family potassium uptake protein [Nostoc edaphicum CCNP1411]|uniref:TrkH family potassium uptake protein n=2 Tax=Nostoc TaxID=1177 RepID=A0A7D7QXU7_9NOSO|nr:TrkH family potassium uptake protein [Nostoc edaphicum CCNP1411]
MALCSVPVSLWFGEYYAIAPFLTMAAAAIILGQLLYHLFPETGESRLRHAMLVAAIGWGMISLFGAIPFWGIAILLPVSPNTPQTMLEFQNPWNAIFEAFSGFTSTGLSVAINASELPRSLQWWRSFTEWIDGVGITVLVLAVLEPGMDAYHLYSAEGREKKIAPTVTDTVQKILWIYALYTVLSIVLLVVLGMPLWDSINHALTGIATGGFSIQDESIGTYNPVIQLAVVLIMITGAISFPIHHQLLTQRHWSILWTDAQHRTLWLVLGIGALVLVGENFWFSGTFVWIDSLFQWVSALTTCGFETTELQPWGSGAKFLLSVAMIFGGAAGSTAGGLKLKRVVTIYRGILWHFQQLFLQPRKLIKYKLTNEVLTAAKAYRQFYAAATLAALWIVSLAIGIFALLHFAPPKYTLSDIILEAASALGNVGLSTGITDPNLPWGGKFTLILLMWVGRLEIVPVLLLFVLPLGASKR